MGIKSIEASGMWSMKGSSRNPPNETAEMTRRHLIKNLHDDIKFKVQLETALAGGAPVLLPTVFNEGTEDERVFWNPLETRYIPNWLKQTKERIEFWKQRIAARDAKRAQKTK